MEAYQREFIEFALQREVLRFGEFTLKSGRLSPYFFNTGRFDTGQCLAKLGRYYAQAIIDSGVKYDMLFGPAYKGIPLVAAIAIGICEVSGRDVPYCFNRKEAKDHGEGGQTVGAKLDGKVLIVDDVVSAGTSARESVEIITAAGAEPVGIAISLDREERGTGTTSATQEIQSSMGLSVVKIVGLNELVAFLEDDADRAESLAAITKYREEYGV
ncbi:MAG: orotate phosphoribosyltransferase [Planctomycetaceae bacterium]